MLMNTRSYGLTNLSLHHSDSVTAQNSLTFTNIFLSARAAVSYLYLHFPRSWLTWPRAGIRTWAGTIQPVKFCWRNDGSLAKTISSHDLNDWSSNFLPCRKHFVLCILNKLECRTSRNTGLVWTKWRPGFHVEMRSTYINCLPNQFNNVRWTIFPL